MSDPAGQAGQAAEAAPVLARPVDVYLQVLRVERGYSPNTITSYRRELGRLQAFMEREGLADWASLKPDMLRMFLAGEHRRGLSATSLQRLLSACRGFFDHLVREGTLLASPAIGVRAPRRARKLPEVLDVDEMAQLLAFEPATPEERRDLALLELLYSSGLRRAEACALRWTDLDLDAGMVRVLGKGRRVRDVPVGRKARAALAALRDQDCPAPTDPVFRSPDGSPLSGAQIWHRVRAVARRQGLARRVYPHLLRHSCASHYLESSEDLRGTQELLGHADISTTQIYTHLSFQHLARVYDKAHPRARRKPGGSAGS